MRHFFLKSVLIGFASSATVLGQSQSALEVLKSGKAATALIEAVDGEATTATAFCIDPSGLFVTNSHVVSTGSQFRLVVKSGTVSQAIYPAKVLATTQNSTSRWSRPREQRG